MSTSYSPLSQVKDVYANFGAGNLPAVLNALSPKVEWQIHGPKEYPFFGHYTGREGVQAFLIGLAAATEISKFQPERFLEAGNQVIVTGSESGTTRNIGRSYNTTWCHIFTIENDKIVSFEEFIDSAPIVAAYQVTSLNLHNL